MAITWQRRSGDQGLSESGNQLAGLLSWLRERTQTAEDLAVNWQARNDIKLSERLW